MPGGNSTAAQQCPRENSGCCTMHLLERKQWLVTLWSSHDHFFSVLPPFSLHLWSTLLPIPFPTARYLSYYTTLCRIPWSSSRFAPVPAALWKEAKLGAELSRLLLSVAREERRIKSLILNSPFRRGNRSTRCPTRQPKCHICLEASLAGGRQDTWRSYRHRSERGGLGLSRLGCR